MANLQDGFPTCLAIVLREEGGFVDDRRDPGGMTNLGVTAAAWQHWIGHMPTEAEMRALTPTIVAPFYRAEYWQPAACDQLPAALALCVFDAAVNEGVPHAAEQLQAAVNAPQDGAIGPGTLRALQQVVTAFGLAKVIGTYANGRRAFYRSRKAFPVFGHGWLARVDRIETAALKLL